MFNGNEEAILAEDMPYPDHDFLQSGLQYHREVINNYFRDVLQTSWFDFDERTFETNRLPKVAGFSVLKGCVARCTFYQCYFLVESWF